MRIGAVVLALSLTFAMAAMSACGGGTIFRQYEYEEEMYLAVDGSATVYVNSSVAALNALRGTAFDASPNALPDRDAVRALYATPVTRVAGSVRTSRRGNRRFVHVRLDVDDVRRLGEAGPLAWSTYQFEPEGELLAYRQTVGAPAGKPATTHWRGDELVAFRMHLPSKVEYHNAGANNPQRGNILAWEQLLTERLEGTPLVFETKIQTESILYRALWLFAVTGVAVTLMFVVVIWLIVRRGEKTAKA